MAYLLHASLTVKQKTEFSRFYEYFTLQSRLVRRPFVKETSRNAVMFMNTSISNGNISNYVFVFIFPKAKELF